MTIEITAAQARAMTGRCEYHGTPLWLGFGPDEDGPENPLDVWACSGWAADPDVVLSHREYTELVRFRNKMPDYGERMRENLAGLGVLEERCRGSWVLTVPEP